MLTALYRLRTLSVADVMNKKITSVRADQSMTDIANLFVEGQLSTAPVVDEQGCCVGVLSATDFLKRDSDSPDHISRDWDLAETHMTRAVQSVSGNATLLNAAKIMCAQHIHHLFVLDHDGRPVGVVSTMDIVAATLKAMEEMDAASG